MPVYRLCNLTFEDIEMRSCHLHGPFKAQSLVCVAIGVLFLSSCASTATLSGRAVQGGDVKKRFCYGGADTVALVEWAKDDGKAFREHLAAAYRSLSDQILTGMIGLAEDPKPVKLWEHTEKACSVQPEGSEVQSNSMARSKK